MHLQIYTKTSRIEAKLPNHHSKYNNRATLSNKIIAQSSKFKRTIQQQKVLFKYIKMSKIGAMLRSFFQLALPARGFSIRILLFGQMELYHPKCIWKYILKLVRLEQNYQIIIASTTAKQHWVKNSTQSSKFKWTILQQKVLFKYIKIKKNWRYAQIILLAGFAGKMVLNKDLFGQMDLYHPKCICKYTKIKWTIQQQKICFQVHKN